MFEQMQSELRKEGIEGKPKFILCILAEKKNSLVYGNCILLFLNMFSLFFFYKLMNVNVKKISRNFPGPWKRRNLVEEGIVTQCIAPTPKINDQYLTNVLLKINSKVISED